MEIIPGVHLVPGIRGTNVYLLLGQELALVDCGMPGSADLILSYIEEVGHRPQDVAWIVITHYHVDHIGGLAAVQARTGAQVLAHPGDAPVISGARAQPGPRGVLLQLLVRVVPAVSRAEAVPVNRLLHDGDWLDLLGGTRVIAAPGHTPGSIALHAPAQKLLISGDLIDRRRGRLGLPPKAFTTDMEQAKASLRRLAALEFDVLCPGHGPPLVGGAADEVRATLAQPG